MKRLRKHYEREVSRINLEYKNQATQKCLLLIRLETRFNYDMRLLSPIEPAPDHIEVINDWPEDSIKNALTEVASANQYIQQTIPCDMLSNLRFYINTPYYSRTQDPFPCYSWMDPRVHAICSLVSAALDRYNLALTAESLPRLNVIVRCYRPGDVLGFHSDRKEFGPHICGFMLKNRRPDHGLMLTMGARTYMMNEAKPYAWCLTDAARWGWEHGYAAPTEGGEEFIRISVTFRFYNLLSQIPKFTNIPAP